MPAEETKVVIATCNNPSFYSVQSTMNSSCLHKFSMSLILQLVTNISGLEPGTTVLKNT